MDLSIVILNYKQKGLVRQSIKGIIAARPKLDYEIIVVDNASGDDCLGMAKKIFHPAGANQEQASLPLGHDLVIPSHQLVQSKLNGGFAVGNNLGIKQAKGEFVLVINPDVAITPGALERMVEFMRQHPMAGIAGAKLINPDGSVQLSARRFPKVLIPLYRRTFVGKLPFARKSLDHYLMSEADHNVTQEVDWLFGAYLLVSRELIQKIGMFDERFFMYFEDLDLCRRSWEAGYSVWYVAEVELVHYHQRMSAASSGFLSILRKGTRVHLASGIKYFAKYLGVPLPRRGRPLPR